MHDMVLTDRQDPLSIYICPSPQERRLRVTDAESEGSDQTDRGAFVNPIGFPIVRLGARGRGRIAA
jgi:hypothetical protein